MEHEKAFALLDKCMNEGRNKTTGKWTFIFENVKVQCVSVFAVKAYIDESTDKTFKEWLLTKKMAKQIERN